MTKTVVVYHRHPVLQAIGTVILGGAALFWPIGAWPGVWYGYLAQGLWLAFIVLCWLAVAGVNADKAAARRGADAEGRDAPGGSSPPLAGPRDWSPLEDEGRREF